MTDREQEGIKPSQDNLEEHTSDGNEDIFSTIEIKIEEMAIDGICGVY